MELAAAVEPDLDGGRFDRGRVDRKLRQYWHELAGRGCDIEPAARALEAVTAGETPRARGPAREVQPLKREIGSSDGGGAIDADQSVDGEMRTQTFDAGERVLRPLEDRAASAASARAHDERDGYQHQRGFHVSERTAGLSGPVPKVSA